MNISDKIKKSANLRIEYFIKHDNNTFVKIEDIVKYLDLLEKENLVIYKKNHDLLYEWKMKKDQVRDLYIERNELLEKIKKPNNNLICDILNQVEDIKEKITDNEYRIMVETLNKYYINT